MGYAKKGAAMKLFKAQYGAKGSGHAWWVLLGLEPKYYLDIDYNPCVDASEKDSMELGCHTYVKEIFVKVSGILRKKNIGKAKCPMDPKGYPELINDDSLST